MIMGRGVGGHHAIKTLKAFGVIMNFLGSRHHSRHLNSMVKFNLSFHNALFSLLGCLPVSSLPAPVLNPFPVRIDSAPNIHLVNVGRLSPSNQRVATSGPLPISHEFICSKSKLIKCKFGRQHRGGPASPNALPRNHRVGEGLAH